MTLVLNDELESAPDAYPDPPPNLSAAAQSIPAGVVWDRLERYTRQRWTPRNVVWQVSVAGRKEAFEPRLQPAVFASARVWDETSHQWESATPIRAPWGVMLECGDWQLTFVVGVDAPPLRALEAYRRLAEYWAEVQGNASLASVKDGDYAASFNANAIGRALQLSGAADLLRPYR